MGNLKRRYYDSAPKSQRVMLAVSAWWIVFSVSWMILFSDQIDWYSSYRDDGYDADEILHLLLHSFGVLVPAWILYFALRSALRRRQADDNQFVVLRDFEREIATWPPEQAAIAAQLLKATLTGDRRRIDELYPELTLGQIQFIGQMISKLRQDE